jgi:hypothetical protein
MYSFEVEVIVKSDELAQEVLWKLHDKYDKNKKRIFLARWGDAYLHHPPVGFSI